MQIVKTSVPCDTTVSCWLSLHDTSLDSLVKESRRYERAYLAWETVRQTRNPFFSEGTGFEGYFVGICHSPEEMLAQLLEIGHQMLESNYVLYRHQYSFRARLMQTLLGECNDLKAIDVWSALFGAALGKLRCNILFNDETYRFQNETYWFVNRLPLIHYTQCARHIQQEYTLVSCKASTISKPDFRLDLLKSSDYDAGLVVSAIGRFGHPLIRAYLEEAE